jgi:hypothetical protein
MAALPDNAARPVLCGGCPVMGIPTAIAFALMSMNELGKAPVTTKLVEESLLCMTAFLQPSMPISTSGRLGRRQR